MFVIFFIRRFEYDFFRNNKQPTKFSRQNKGEKTMKKISQQQLRLLVEQGIIDEAKASDMVASGMASASTRAGKLGYANEEIKRAFDNLMNVIELNLEDWNQNLADNHIDTIESTKKITLNIKK